MRNNSILFEYAFNPNLIFLVGETKFILENDIFAKMKLNNIEPCTWMLLSVL